MRSRNSQGLAKSTPNFAAQSEGVSADDITRVKTMLVAEGRPRVPLVAKLERPER